MRHPNRRRLGPAVAALVLCLFVSPSSADWTGDYFTAVMGTVWTYENVDQPGLYRTESVFESLDWEGHPAVRLGGDLTDHSVVQNTGHVVTIYAQTEEGVLLDFPNDLDVGWFEDGVRLDLCPFPGDCDSTLIRVWTALDPSLRSIYGLDPGVTDLVVFASYDSDYDKNLHNTVLESNLPPGRLPPTGAVTGVEWFQWKRGSYADLDVDADSGGFGEYWRLVDFVSGVDGMVPSAGARLGQNVPNPFNPLTRIPFELVADVPVSLTIHDPRGRLVAVLADGWRPGVGDHGRDWDGRDAAGRPVSGGVYFYRLAAGGESTVRSLVLVR
ncbi:MAG: hypothetical protein GY838_10990 [bacterium]|nr:hypothetical protein [bacterium]